MSFLLGILQIALVAQTPPVEKGPPVGQQLPQFALRDQFGREQTPTSLVGSKGFVLLLFRSADW